MRKILKKLNSKMKSIKKMSNKKKISIIGLTFCLIIGSVLVSSRLLDRKVEGTIIAKNIKIKKKDQNKKDNKSNKQETIDQIPQVSEQPATSVVANAPVVNNSTPAPVPQAPPVQQRPTCNPGVPTEATNNGIWWMKDYNYDHDACNKAVWDDMNANYESGVVGPVFDNCGDVIGYTKSLI